MVQAGADASLEANVRFHPLRTLATYRPSRRLRVRYASIVEAVMGESLAERVGKQRARTAVSRKLAVTMLAMWKSGESYQGSRGELAKPSS